MKIAVIFTNDWELRGDGSGSFYELQEKPMQQLIEFGNSEKVGFTFFAEIGQQYYHLYNASLNDEISQIATDWEKNILNAIDQKHDVQLHLHSQWINAKFKLKWILNSSHNTNLISDAVFNRFITWGKYYLENLISKVDENYNCFAFRSGGNVELSKNKLSILIDKGFLLDCSPIIGFYSKNFYDYRNVLYPFPFNSNQKINAMADYYYLPQFADKGIDSPFMRHYLPRIFYFMRYQKKIDKKFLFWQKKIRQKLSDYAIKDRPFTSNYLTNLSKMFRIFINYRPLRLDYDNLPPEIFLHLIKKFLRQNKFNERKTIPFVAIGHTKQMPDLENLQLIVTRLKNEFGENIYFPTLTQFYNQEISQ